MAVAVDDHRAARSAAAGSRHSRRPLLGQPLAHAAHVEAELAGRVPLARPASFSARAREASSTAAALVAADDDHAVVVGHDHVARVDELAGADDRDVDVAEGLLDRASRRHARDQTGNRIFGQLGTSRQPASMTRPRTPARVQRGGQQLAEVPVVAPGRRRHHEDVAVGGTAPRRRGSSSCRRAATLTVTAVPEIRAPRVDRVAASGQQAACGPAPRARWRRRTARTRRRWPVGPAWMVRYDDDHAHSCQGKQRYVHHILPCRSPPIALIARSTCASPKVWVASRSSGNRPEASCLSASSQAR